MLCDVSTMHYKMDEIWLCRCVTVLSVRGVSHSVAEWRHSVRRGRCGVHTSAREDVPRSSVQESNQNWSPDTKWKSSLADWRHLHVVRCCSGITQVWIQSVSIQSAFFLSFFRYNVAFGFVCINKHQEDKQCDDYQVILTCPSDFCQSKLWLLCIAMTGCLSPILY